MIGTLRSLFTLGLIVVTLDASSSPTRVLRFADGQDVHTLNPILTTQYNEQYVSQLTAAHLTRLDAQRRPMAELAQAIPTRANSGISADGLTITYHLRRGLRWSDGAPLDAADVIFTLDLIRAPNSIVPSAQALAGVASYRAVDSLTIVVRLKHRQGSFAELLFASSSPLAILPRHLLAGVDLATAPYNALPVGAGPFRVRAWRRGDAVEMEANPYYARGRPKLDRIDYVVVPDENTLGTQMLSGEIDLIPRAPVDQMHRFAGQPQIHVERVPSLLMSWVDFNLSAPPLDDVNVRRALKLGTDRAQIVRDGYHGYSAIQETPIAAADPFANLSIPRVPYDPAAANALLDRAGWKRGSDGVRVKNGVPLAITIFTIGKATGAETELELLRTYWSALGVSVANRGLEANVLFGPGGAVIDGRFQAILDGGGSETNAMTDGYACDRKPPRGYNLDRYCDPTVDALLARADQSYDRSERARLYGQAQQKIADAVVQFSFRRDDIGVYRSRVVGYHSNGVTPFDGAMKIDVRDP